MKRLWGNFWIRISTTALFAIVTNILSHGLLLSLAWAGFFLEHTGPDFAGGAVIHITPWIVILPVWIAAEIKALWTGTSLLLGCYLIFLMVIVFGTNSLPTLSIGFVDQAGAEILSVVDVVVSTILAAGLSALYYVFQRRRLTPATN